MMAFGIALLAGLAVFLILIVALYIIYPVWSMIHCLMNPKLSTGSKVAWFCLMLFTWVIGACLYAYFASEKTLFKVLGTVGLSLSLLALAFKGPLLNLQKTALMSSLERVQLVDLTEADRATLKSQVASLDPSNN